MTSESIEKIFLKAKIFFFVLFEMSYFFLSCLRRCGRRNFVVVIVV